MFARLSAAILLTLPLLAVADCSSGSLQCCDSAHESEGAVGYLLKNILGIEVQDITGLVGVNCGPLSSGCAQQTLCCSNNNFNGLVVLGCSPIDIDI